MVHRDIGEVQGEGQAVEPAQPFHVEHLAARRDPQPVRHRGRCGDRADGAYLVGDPAVRVQGLGETHQPVERMRILLAHHHRSHTRLACHELFGTEQVEGLADGVAGHPVVRADHLLVRQHPVGEEASEHLVPQQVGELPGAVRTEAATARGGYRSGVLAGAFGWHAVDPTERIRPSGVAAVLRHLPPSGQRL